MTRIYHVGPQYGIGILRHGPGDSEAVIVGAQHKTTHKPYPPERGDVVVDARIKPATKIIVDRAARLLRGPQGFRGWIAHGFIESPIVKQINEPKPAKRKEWAA